ncbi:MAG: ion transporter [Myxococcota bacterium]
MSRAPEQGLLPHLRSRANLLIHHPATEIALVVLIVTEATLPAGGRPRTVVEHVGDLITWIFVAELSIRLWVAPRKRRFFRRYWLDILAVAPLIRPLRMFRVLRLLRLFRAGMPAPTTGR